MAKRSDTQHYHRAIKPLYFLSRIVGLMPVSPFKTDDNVESCILKCLHVFWTLIWIATITTVVCLFAFSGVVFDEQDFSITFIVISFYFWSTYLTCMINFLINIIFRNTFTEIISKFNTLDEVLIAKSDVELYKKERRWLITDIATILVTYAIIDTGVCWFFDVETVLEAVFCIFGNMPLFIITLVALQFKTWVKRINERLQIIKKILEKCIKSEQITLFKPIRKNKISNLLQDMDEVPNEGINNQSEEIQQLELIYIDVYKLNLLVNSTYGMSIVCQIITCYIVCVTALYWGINTLTAKEYQMKSVVFFGLCVYTLWLLAWILFNCHMASAEAVKIIIFVQEKIRKHRFLEDVERALLNFVTLIKEMPIEFTACELLTLNLPFLCSTVGVICSYIVILVQIKT
ncbi:hypothetical protein L9F63_014817 [Diploptera punctata]|uniref:Gustatory receptor n=1 Tax=Diploptera punctata TaxID=6984 RepID=A0AAD8EKX8_DIPPU|nr:hypothetical protein L9F63_014817 [Diploptera punctata]